MSLPRKLEVDSASLLTACGNFMRRLMVEYSLLGSGKFEVEFIEDTDTGKEFKFAELPEADQKQITAQLTERAEEFGHE